MRFQGEHRTWNGRRWTAVAACVAAASVLAGCSKGGGGNPLAPSLGGSSVGAAAPASANTGRRGILTVQPDQDDYSPGSVVTISGDNSNGAGYVPGNAVDVSVVGPNGWTASCSAVVADDGSWSCQITLSPDPEIAVGSYTVTVTSTAADGSTITETTTFTDAAQNTSLTLNLSATTITYGQVITATGKLSGNGASGVQGVTVNLTKYSTSSCDSGAVNVASTTTGTGASAGNYSIGWRPSAAGTYYVKATFAGSGGFPQTGFNPSESPTCSTVTVNKAPTATSITNTPATTLALGNSLSVDYKVQSAYGVSGNTTVGNVSINETDVLGTLGCGAGDTLSAAQANADGTGAADAGFAATGTLNCTPTAVGSYTYKVSYAGETNYLSSASSPDQNLEVTVEVCKAAPAIAVEYMKDVKGTRPGSPKWKEVVNAVAMQTGRNGDFFAQNVCAAGYADDVRTFVNGFYVP